MRLAFILGLVVLAAGCSNPVAPEPPPPPPSPNTLPRVAIVSPMPQRVEAGESIELRADVEDAETPLGQLISAWAADGLGGTFAPLADARHVRWTSPSAMAPRA